MANPTTNYGFVLPTSSDLVTDLPADFDVALQGVDTRLKALQPGTTLGDLAYSSATANTNTRLGIGTTGQVLSVSGGVPTWTTPSTGAVVQVKSTVFSTSTSNSTSTYEDTGLTLSITPTSASNKILVLVNQNVRNANSAAAYETAARVRLMRNSTAIYYDSDMFMWYAKQGDEAGDFRFLSTMIYLDSPATTSAVTYKTQQKQYVTTITAQPFGSSSTITLMEVTP